MARTGEVADRSNPYGRRMVTPTADRAAPPTGHDWQTAGRAWGARATDWAYLTEPGAWQVYEAVFDAVVLDARSRVLDVACGSGGALVAAARRGATVAGIDASDPLVAIARQRLPHDDIRVGTMFDLPFADDSFDVVTSFNGIWNGNQGALGEVRRVVRSGGRVALTFWSAQPGDHLAVLAAIVGLQPRDEARVVLDRASIANAGVAEDMLRAAGLTPRSRGRAPLVHEWPDPELACRAFLAGGPAWAAIAQSGEMTVRKAVFEALEPFTDARTGVRLRSDYEFVVADA